MLKKELKKIPGSRIEVLVTVAWDEWKKFIDGAAEELSKELKIPGFRPGKAPLAMVEQKVGKMRILETAAEKSIQKTYAQIVEEEKLEVIGAPQAEMLKVAEGNDLEYRITSAVMPEVKLEKWEEKIEAVNAEFAKQLVDISEAEISGELEKLANTRAKLITVSRAAENGDSVLVDFEVKQAGVVIENGTSRNHPLILGKGMFIPGFEEQLVGLKEGEEKEFELAFPEKYHAEHLAGKKASFKVKMNLVQERQIPALDDDFAKSLGKFENLEALRASIREGMAEEKKAKQKEEKRTRFVETLISLSDIDLPEVLIHQEIHKMIDEFSVEIQSMGMNLETYLDKIGKSLDDLEKDWEPQAEKRVKAALLLEKLAANNQIEIPAEEIEAEMNKTLQFYKNVKNIEKNIDMTRLYNYTKGMLQNEKVFALLEGTK